jgi:hypothetical protein
LISPAAVEMVIANAASAGTAILAKLVVFMLTLPRLSELLAKLLATASVLY